MVEINLPFSVKDRVDHPISLYAASKKSTELLPNIILIYKIKSIGLRFLQFMGHGDDQIWQLLFL